MKAYLANIGIVEGEPKDVIEKWRKRINVDFSNKTLEEFNERDAQVFYLFKSTSWSCR